MQEAGLAWRIEEVCWNGFPALRQVILGDWLIRFAEGLSRRANSVNPLRPTGSDIATAIAAAERLYPAQGLPPIFRIPSIADPAFDADLTAQGYTSEGESLVLYAPLAAAAEVAPDPAVRLLPAPEPMWCEAMFALQGHSAAQRNIYRRIVAAIAIPARFALLAVGERPVALAYGALHDGLLVYESVVTDPAQRRRGLARRLIGALAAWAREEGAEGLSLQVEASNTPARALYTGFGFTELYRYHYRRAPLRT